MRKASWRPLKGRAFQAQGTGRNRRTEAGDSPTVSGNFGSYYGWNTWPRKKRIRQDSHVGRPRREPTHSQLIMSGM